VIARASGRPACATSARSSPRRGCPEQRTGPWGRRVRTLVEARSPGRPARTTRYAPQVAERQTGPCGMRSDVRGRVDTCTTGLRDLGTLHRGGALPREQSPVSRRASRPRDQTTESRPVLDPGSMTWSASRGSPSRRILVAPSRRVRSSLLLHLQARPTARRGPPSRFRHRSPSGPLPEQSPGRVRGVTDGPGRSRVSLPRPMLQ
jgi:hypothetical protein